MSGAPEQQRQVLPASTGRMGFFGGKDSYRGSLGAWGASWTLRKNKCQWGVRFRKWGKGEEVG